MTMKSNPPDMIEVVYHCFVCKSKNHRLFERYEDGTDELQYLICENCGVVFQSPRMKKDDLNRFYKEGYRTHSQATEAPTKKDLIMQQERARYALRQVHDDIEKVDQHLDIGSSSGAFLAEFQERYRCESVGVEPGDTYRKFSGQQGFTVYPSIETIPPRSKPFSLVSMMHVLEHLPDPVDYLRNLRDKLMATDGYLLVEVPNLYEHEAFELAHLYAYTPATLRETVRQAGFVVHWVKTHGSFRSPILNLFITLLAQVSDQPQSQLPVSSKPWGTAARRRIGTFKRHFFSKWLPDWTWQAPRALWDEGEIRGQSDALK